MLTSYYAQWSKNWLPGGISTSRSQLLYSYPIYAPLVPGSWFHDLRPVDYIPRYEAQLANLNARIVWEELKEIATGNAIAQFGLTAAKASMVEPVLLGWEKPGDHSAAFCHRRLVAQWLQAELGHVVSEGHVNSKGDRVLTPSFDTLCHIEADGTFVRLDKETAQGQFTLNLF